MFIDRVHPNERQGLADRLNQAIEKEASRAISFPLCHRRYRTFDRAYIIVRRGR